MERDELIGRVLWDLSTNLFLETFDGMYPIDFTSLQKWAARNAGRNARISGRLAKGRLQDDDTVEITDILVND